MALATLSIQALIWAGCCMSAFKRAFLYYALFSAISIAFSPGVRNHNTLLADIHSKKMKLILRITVPLSNTFSHKQESWATFLRADETNESTDLEVHLNAAVIVSHKYAKKIKMHINTAFRTAITKGGMGR